MKEELSSSETFLPEQYGVTFQKTPFFIIGMEYTGQQDAAVYC
jgi:hypothetical protein